MNRSVTLGILLATALTFYGCGSAEEATPAKKQQSGTQQIASGNENAPGTSQNAKKEVPQKQNASGPSSECAGTNEVEVAAKHSAHEKYASLGWDNLKSVFASRVPAGLGADGTAVVVYMATKEITPKQVNSPKKKELLGEEGFVKVSFTNGKGADPDVAEYSISDDNRAAHRVSFSVQQGGTGYSVSKSNWGKPDAVGTGSITYMSEDRICGEFSLDDPWRTLKGTFDAKLYSTAGADVMQKGR